MSFPPSQNPIVSCTRSRAVHVLVLLSDVDTAYPGPEIVDLVQLMRLVDELVEYGSSSHRRYSGGSQWVRIVLDLAQLLLLAPSLFIGRSVRRRQHALANLAGKSGRVDENVHVGVAGSHPQAVPARYQRDRVLRAALGLFEKLPVVLVGSGERSQRGHDLECRSIPAAERSWLREEHRRCAGEREPSDGDPAKAQLEIHVSFQIVSGGTGMLPPQQNC